MRNEDLIRAIAHDREGRVFTDEVLAPFLELAARSIPYIAAGLAAESRGLSEHARFWLSCVPHAVANSEPDEQDESAERARRVVQAAIRLAKAGTSCGAGELPYESLHALYDAVREYEREG